MGLTLVDVARFGLTHGRLALSGDIVGNIES